MKKTVTLHQIAKAIGPIDRYSILTDDQMLYMIMGAREQLTANILHDNPRVTEVSSPSRVQLRNLARKLSPKR